MILLRSQGYSNWCTVFWGLGKINIQVQFQAPWKFTIEHKGLIFMPPCIPCTGVNLKEIKSMDHRAPFVKSLGFYIDGNLECGEHVCHVIKKVSSGIAILK